MKNVNKMLLALFVVTILSTVSVIPVYAAEGLEGYAIHRDGAFMNTTWHAGLMDESQPNRSLSVTHAGQSKSTVKYDSWADFLNGNNFKGFYMPKSGIASNGRDNVKSMGRKLISENLLYTPVQQITADAGNATWISPSHISAIRCDGVVEFCYEYFGYRIYGNDEKWDISKNGNQSHHALASVTPKVQAENYMSPWFNIINVNSNKGLDVPDGSTYNGTNLAQWAVTGGGGNNQKWKLDYTASGDYFSLIPKHAQGKAVEITNTSSANNEAFQIWDIQSFGYMDSQKFRLTTYSDGSVAFHSYPNYYSKVMTVSGASTANGATIVQMTASSDSSKRWNLVPTSP